MKEFDFYSESKYTKLLKMKSYLKLCAISTFSVLGVAVFTAGIVLGVVHFRNTSGQGGREVPGFSELTQELIEDNSAGFVEDVQDNDNLSYFSYRIKKGDMIGNIAEEFGVTQDTIISVNNIHSSRLIQIGQYLKIPSMPGILYTVRMDGETVNSIAQKYSVQAEKCSAVNRLGLDDSLKAGKTLFVPDAALDWVTRQEINGDLFVKPIHSRFYFTSSFGWRQNPFDSSKRTYHNGIDMACPKGTAVYAALNGVVASKGWSDVYGNYLIISHHSGYKTLYAHMNEPAIVNVGQSVTRGTIVGRVGNTGMSTGPHLHFTVYKNGRTVNPANLWK